MVFIPKKRIKNNRPISPEAEENDSESDTEQPPSKVKKSDEQGIVSKPVTLLIIVYYLRDFEAILVDGKIIIFLRTIYGSQLKREKSSEHVIIP